MVGGGHKKLSDAYFIKFSVISKRLKNNYHMILMYLYWNVYMKNSTRTKNSIRIICWQIGLKDILKQN